MNYIRLSALVFCLFPAMLFSGLSDYSSWLSDINGQNSGHTVAGFLSLPSSAGELGTGSAAFCGMMDATDACFYTANTALFNRDKFSVTHLEWLMGLRKESIADCFPIEEVGTAGFFSQVFTPGQFSNARDIDEDPSNPSMVDYSIGLSFAKSFFEQHVAAGAAVSYVESRLDNSVGRTVSVNADVTVIPAPWLFGHFYAGNLSPGLSYSTGETKELLPLQVGCAFSMSPFAYEEALSAIIDPKINVGVKKTADEPLIIGAGLQGTLIKFLTLRTGYDYSLGNASGMAGLNAGVGIEEKTLSADFGWRYQSKDFGSVWSASIKMRLNELSRKTAEEQYRTAEQYFKTGSYRQSLRFAHKALDLDPNLWKAHTLISTIDALQRRESGLEMVVIYTGNTKGRFLPALSQDQSIGGLARQAAVIRHLRAQFPLAITIDAGNAVVGASPQNKESLADAYFGDLGYEAISLGKGELDFGLSKMFPKDKKTKTQYLCSNIRGTYGTDIISKKTIAVGPYTFFIMAVIGPSLPDESENAERLSPVIDELSAGLSKSAAKNATLRILIVNDAWENITALARALPGIDIILCGNIKQKFETPMKAGTTAIISPGDGESVGKLVLRFNRDKKLVSFDNHCIPLASDIAPDSGIESKLRAIMGNLDVQEFAAVESGFKKGHVDGVFAFLSDRGGAPGIFLKMIDKQAEYPLTGKNAACSKPVVSFSGGKIAYFENRVDTAYPAPRIMDISGVNKRTIAFNGRISDMRFSPDGKWLYFTGRTDSSSGDIYRIKPEASTFHPVISWKNSSETMGDFSPDGANMIFLSNGNGKNQLYLTDTLGERPICITEGNGDNIAPSFSPSGTYCAFLSNKTSFAGTYDVWLYDRAEGKAMQMTVQADVRNFCWLPDSKAIVYSGGKTRRSLYRLDIRTDSTVALIPGDSVKNYDETSPMTISYKSGVKIIYTQEYPGGDQKIFWVNPDGTANRRIISSKARDWLE
jgi:Tol biopolymer transport system component